MRKLAGLALFGGFLAFAVSPASAGNIALTGHDDDLHCFGTTAASCLQLNAMVTFARSGSALPVLSFDSGTELTSDLTSFGIPFTNVDPNNAAAVTDALFNPANFSAFIVASDTSCGGCDNSPAGEANIAAHATAIGNFLNAGRGIVGFAGASSPNYYAFVPQTATSVGGAPSTGYSQTAVGVTLGIPAVNGDPTHNLFFNPGTNGESAFYQIVEVNLTTGNGTILPPAAVTLACASCTVSGGVIIAPPPGGAVPEPATIGLFLTGLGGLFLLRRKA